MKAVYWKEPHRPVWAQLATCVVAVVALGLVERFQPVRTRPHLAEKLQAARLAQRAMGEIRRERIRRKLPIDSAHDPAGTGLIGGLMTPVTSDPGSLRAKQTTLNPNFAAVVLQMFQDAGVKEGDTVAVGLSGSFPALNICVLAAAQTLKLRPIIISSAAASQWGANLPGLLWLDMERHLHQRGLFAFRSVAASIGGLEDRGEGMSDRGRVLLAEAIRRNELPAIKPRDFRDSIRRRMQIYRRHQGTSPIKAYVNVGGGSVSVGTRIGKRLFRPGLNRRPPHGIDRIDSVMARFSRAGVPVIHLVQIEELAARYGLPICPRSMPRAGHGLVYAGPDYDPWLTLAALLAIVLLLQATKPAG